MSRGRWIAVGSSVPLLGLLAVALLVVAGADPTDAFSSEREGLRSCEGAVFTTAPVDLTELRDITPLGNLDPPGHTMPTEHTYLNFHAAQGQSTTVYPLFAPGDITLLQVRSARGYLDPEDYSIMFALCEDVYGYFNHVKFLSDEMKALLAGAECMSRPGGNDGSESCEMQVFASVPAGTLLGEVGRLQSNFDFGALDMRTSHTMANAQRYEFARTPNIVCAYDYYEGELKERLYSLLARSEEPRCGEIALDRPGTLQGNWYQTGSDAVIDWDGHLALVPDNHEPSILVISVGGVLSEPGWVEFTPTPSGTINRAFEDVSADGRIYCFERDGTGRRDRFQSPKVLNGRLLVQLVNATELQIEQRSGRCSAGEAFSAPTTYFR